MRFTGRVEATSDACRDSDCRRPRPSANSPATCGNVHGLLLPYGPAAERKCRFSNTEQHNYPLNICHVIQLAIRRQGQRFEDRRRSSKALPRRIKPKKWPFLFSSLWDWKAAAAAEFWFFGCSSACLLSPNSRLRFRFPYLYRSPSKRRRVQIRAIGILQFPSIELHRWRFPPVAWISVRRPPRGSSRCQCRNKEVLPCAIASAAS